MVLNEMLGIDSKIINVSSGAEIANLVPDLIDHFERIGTPIMIGGGVLAHTIVGVAYDDATRKSAFLILDPHYTGAHNASTIKAALYISLRNCNNLQRVSTVRRCFLEYELVNTDHR